jgi:hypothetical protein
MQQEAQQLRAGDLQAIHQQQQQQQQQHMVGVGEVSSCCQVSTAEAASLCVLVAACTILPLRACARLLLLQLPQQRLLLQGHVF